MDIAIITGNENAPGARALMQAAVARGHRAVPSNFKTDKARQDVLQSDIVIPRFGHEMYKTAIEAATMYAAQNPTGLCAVSAQAIQSSFDKYAAYNVMAANNIATPATDLIKSPADLATLVAKLPLILKPLDENRGRGIVVVHSEGELKTAAAELLQTYGSCIAQEFIAEANGADIRAFVVGDKVVAAMERTAPQGSAIANLAQGGTAQPVVLTKDESELAVRVAHLLGAGYAGVDLLRSQRGPLVLEVNASPGLKIAEVTGIDVATQIIDYLVDLKETRHD